MRIIAAHDGGSGCTWYRLYVPLKAAAEHGGHEVTFYSANPTAAERLKRALAAYRASSPQAAMIGTFAVVRVR